MADNNLGEGEIELWSNGQWRVTSHALEEADGGSGYWIANNELSRPGWVEHMSEKTWVDIEAFKEAYRKACELAGIDIPPPPRRDDPRSVYSPDLYAVK